MSHGLHFPKNWHAKPPVDLQVRVEDMTQRADLVVDVVMAAEDKTRRIDQDLGVPAHHGLCGAALYRSGIQVLDDTVSPHGVPAIPWSGSPVPAAARQVLSGPNYVRLVRMKYAEQADRVSRVLEGQAFAMVSSRSITCGWKLTRIEA